MGNRVIIGLGSNIDAHLNLKRAVDLLQQNFRLLKRSSVLRTAPVGIINQPDFYNSAVLLETDLERDELSIRLKEMEDILGRNRLRPKFGPREIDIDILVWNDEIVDDDYYHRDFLQQLVSEITAK
ncbi:MAG: 2-amino-4-hydroxy-6-hydroxymethyldihydropteridine diphosphokinase [Anaerophaga sp.]|uniref:2-amino-4-hydroxy-6- hydroxymethyldihydropteridine diphosphokinase n=1 Tax=Anaerophaga thermohalophila TaxID=177400 RepID=UPI000237CA0E|nr:2-amino-4-hydroxy-6-hydroxymethyldihydropteridine diphosphokinase [Anaerophaga thermohalophila]MDN5292515.1 2-amino-4-hydroxy-6-hydroxymethyldihydropteridine diphosphokinase [Anaerophaga sp.]